VRIQFHFLFLSFCTYLSGEFVFHHGQIFKLAERGEVNYFLLFANAIYDDNQRQLLIRFLLLEFNLFLIIFIEMFEVIFQTISEIIFVISSELKLVHFYNVISVQLI